MLHLQKIIRGSLNVLADVAAVRRSIEKRPQDQHVQRALKEIRVLLLFFSGHRRHSTTDIADSRTSTIDGQARTGASRRLIHNRLEVGESWADSEQRASTAGAEGAMAGDLG